MSAVVRASLRIEPSALAVRDVGPWLRQALDAVDPAVAALLLSRVELAVHEACMNVVDHAHLPEGSGIDLFLELNDEHLLVRVSDAGDEFDLAAVPEPARGALQERGYGVKIIRSLVTELTYRRVGATNELQLRIDIPPKP